MIAHGSHLAHRVLGASTNCLWTGLADLAHRAGMVGIPPSTIGERIRIARTSRGMSQEKLGELIGTGQTTVSSWERGRTEPNRADSVRIAQTLRLPLSDIEGIGEGTGQLAFREVPVISWVSAGRLEDASELLNVAGTRLMVADLPSGGEYFATDVRGDSMDRVSPEGSRLIVNATDRDPQPGKYYIFSLRGETTYKRFQRDPVIRLEPFSTNPANQTIFPNPDRGWSVIGRVVRSFIDFG